VREGGDGGRQCNEGGGRLGVLAGGDRLRAGGGGEETVNAGGGRGSRRGVAAARPRHDRREPVLQSSNVSAAGRIELLAKELRGWRGAGSGEGGNGWEWDPEVEGRECEQGEEWEEEGGDGGGAEAGERRGLLQAEQSAVAPPRRGQTHRGDSAETGRNFFWFLPRFIFSFFLPLLLRFGGRRLQVLPEAWIPRLLLPNSCFFGAAAPLHLFFGSGLRVLHTTYRSYCCCSPS
jgi:hypothetical protein